MQESTYQTAKEYLTRLENNKWRMQLDEQKMRDLNQRTQRALSNLLLKKNVSGAEPKESNLLLKKLKKLGHKKTIIDIGQLDPLVAVYEKKIEHMEREAQMVSQEQASLKNALESLVRENEELRSKIEEAIRREILVCQNSKKYIEEVEGRSQGIQNKVQTLEREKGKDLLKLMDSLQMYKAEIEDKEAQIERVEDSLAQAKANLREALRREKKLVEQNEHMQEMNEDLKREVKTGTERVAEMEEDCRELEELKKLMGETNPLQMKKVVNKVIEWEAGGAGEAQGKREEQMAKQIRQMREEVDMVKMQSQAEAERREMVEEEMRHVGERAQRITQEKTDLFRKLKETEMQLRSLEGSSEGRARAFEELTAKLKKVIQKKSDKIDELERNLEAKVKRLKGDSQKELRDYQREREEILRRGREEAEKRESLERTLMVKQEVIEGLKKERDFFRDKAEESGQDHPQREELQKQRETLKQKCDQFMKVNMNLVQQNKQLKTQLSASERQVEGLTNDLRTKELEKLEAEVRRSDQKERDSQFDETIEYKKSQNFFFKRKKPSREAPKMNLDCYFKVEVTGSQTTPSRFRAKPSK